MNYLLKPLLLLLIFSFTVDALRFSLWPQPTEIKDHKKDFKLDYDEFVFQSVGSESDILKKGIKRHANFLKLRSRQRNRPLDRSSKSTSKVKTLAIRVLDPDTSLHGQTLENYTLIINSPMSYLDASTVYGALRGLETFSQLIDFSLPLIPKISIKDKPRYPFRGLYLDTSKHELPINQIYQYIDLMSAVKLNVLHWKLLEKPQIRKTTEDSSISTFLKGTNSLSEEAKHFLGMKKVSGMNIEEENVVQRGYSRKEAIEVIDYAKERGIRVLPEISLDSSQTLEWASDNTDNYHAHNPVTKSGRTKCYDERGTFLGMGPYNPTQGETYKYLDQVVEQLGKVFPDRIMHLSSESVTEDRTCWFSNEQLVAWVEEHSYELEEPALLHSELHRRLSLLLQKRSRQALIWEDDVLLPNIPLSAIIDVRETDNWTHRLAAATKKHSTILSAPWSQPSPQTFDMEYSLEPSLYCTSHRYLLGGKLTLSEPTSNFLQHISSFAAISERLWSSKSVRELSSAVSRANFLTERLQIRFESRS